MPLLLVSNKVRVSRVEVQVMVKPRLPGLRLALYFSNILSKHTVNLVLVRTVKIIIFRCVRTNKNYFSEKRDCTN